MSTSSWEHEWGHTVGTYNLAYHEQGMGNFPPTTDAGVAYGNATCSFALEPSCSEHFRFALSKRMST